MAILEEIRQLIEAEYASGATQTEIAEKFGLRQNVISRWRSGKRAVGKMQLETFLKMFPHAKIELNASGNTFSGNANGNVIQNNVVGDNHVHNCPQTPQESELLERFRKLALSKQAKIICLLDDLEQ